MVIRDGRDAREQQRQRLFFVVRRQRDIDQGAKL
jgi:hypothetical protein